jgi:hypothetical protein
MSTTTSIFRSVFVLIALVFATQTASAQLRELKEGEPVYLEIQNDPDPKTLEVGHQIQFRTTSNVMVAGKEVIRAFSPAVGTVLSIERQGYNTTGVIKIEVRHVRAVDGQQVLVSGPVNLSVPNIHTPATVYVKNAIDIEVR